mmetsp:Transcript_9130/g.12256  ORF Transcript_9130/g.12256 Transcript_9130/m.12256 type:complete len:217 (-) Transcript_9130:32-682(-)
MKFFLLALFFAVAFGQAEYNVSNLQVYYESLCPDSIGLITGSLNDAFNNVPELFTLEMVPFGKAVETGQAPNGTYTFTCQHGPDECVGNEQECCIIAIFKDYNLYFPIIECMEASGAPQSPEVVDNCTKGVNADKVHQCYNSGQGSVLEHYAGLITGRLSPPLTFVPWVMINGVQTYDYNDLTRTLCNMQYQDCPAGCNNVHPQGCHPEEKNPFRE